GPAPSTGPSLPAGPPHLAAALFCQPGESVDFPGRCSASLNLQGGGAQQSPTPQDAENGLPRANPGTPHRPQRSRHSSCCPHTRSPSTSNHPSLYEGTINPGSDAKVSICEVFGPL